MNLRRHLPPHPGPLPWGEGETVSRLDKTRVFLDSIQRKKSTLLAEVLGDQVWQNAYPSENKQVLNF